VAPASVLALLGGLAVGSFVTVVAHRVPLGESIVSPRSRCPQCGTQIAAFDNVPVISWALLRGRSRCCQTAISARYPLTELALGALYVATVLVLRNDPTRLALGIVFVTMLAAITLTDLERRLIPNKILFVTAALGVAIAALLDPGSLPERAIGAAAAGGLLFIAALAYPRGMGLGDVKLAATMGLFLGLDIGPAMVVALLSGSLVGLAIMARRGAAARKLAIPFGPFLAIGGAVGLLAGGPLLHWYLGAFG
jgi:leader peptidase (prepilin peptidase) / N-methyltransferase